MLYDKKRWEPKVTTPKPRPKPWQKLLLEAADYIHDHGWIRRRREDFAGHVCILGALDRVGFDHSVRDQTARALAGYLGKGIADWNDNIAKSQRQVVMKLRACAKKG